MTDHGGAASPRTEAITSLDNAITEAGALGLEDATLPVWHAITLRDLALAAQEAPAPEGLRAAIMDALYGLAGGVEQQGEVRVRIEEAAAAIDTVLDHAAPPSPAEPPRPEIAWAIHRDSSRDRHPPECEHGLAWEHCFRARPPAPATKAEIAAGLAQIAAGETPAYIRGYNAGFDEGWQARAEAHPPEGLDPELVSLLEDAIGRFRQAGRENTALWFENALAARLSARGAEPR